MRFDQLILSRLYFIGVYICSALPVVAQELERSDLALGLITDRGEFVSIGQSVEGSALATFFDFNVSGNPIKSQAALIYGGEDLLEFKFDEGTFGEFARAPSESTVAKWQLTVPPLSTSPPFTSVYLPITSSNEDADRQLSAWVASSQATVKATNLAAFLQSYPEYSKGLSTANVIVDRPLVTGLAALMLASGEGATGSPAEFLAALPVQNFSSMSYQDSSFAIVPFTGFSEGFLKLADFESSAPALRAFQRAVAVPPPSIESFTAKKISIFHLFADQSVKELELEIAFQDALKEIAPKEKCPVSRSVEKPYRDGIVVCDYHATEIGISADFWMRTTFSFSIFPVPESDDIDVVIGVSSGFDPRKIDDKPDRFTLLDDSTEVQRQAEKLAKIAFVKIASNQ